MHNVVPAVCLGGLWACVGGARVYERVAADETCLPYWGEVEQLGTLGVTFEHEGECVSLVDEVNDPGLAQAPVFEHQPQAFGACPMTPLLLSEGMSAVDRSALPGDALVSVLEAVSFRERVWIFTRLYVPDPDVVFGLRSTGISISHWDPDRETVVVGGDAIQLEGFEYGEAALVEDDWLYLYGCQGPVDILRTECRVARTQAEPTDVGAWVHWDGRDWTRDARHAEVVLESGPERWGVSRIGDRLVRLAIPGFGSEVRVSTASRPEGPWRRERRLLRCELPVEDPEAFCREPQLRLDQMDPVHPDELVISYDVPTLAPARVASVDAYWPRLVHVEL